MRTVKMSKKRKEKKTVKMSKKTIYTPIEERGVKSAVLQGFGDQWEREFECVCVCVCVAKNMNIYQPQNKLIMLFGLTSSSRLFFPQRFGRLILRPSSGLSRTRELWTQPFIVPGYHVLIPLRSLLLLLLNAVAASIDAVIVLDWTQHLGGLPIFDSTP